MVLKSRLPAPDWSAGEDPDREAKCRKHPLPTNHNVADDPWFHDEQEAAPICNGTYDNKVCPMREACLLLALVNNEQFGIFGGLFPIQRRWVRKHIPREYWTTNYSRKWHAFVPSLEEFEEDEDDDASSTEA